MAGFKNAKRVRPEDDSDVEVETTSSKTSKKVKTGAADLESGKDSEGNSWWGLSGKRRVGISEFKKQAYINIREHYVDGEGVWKPGKKGISLPLEQYNALLRAIPAINAELASQGLDVADVPSAAPPSNAVQKSAPKEKKRPKRSNIEATSDEEEDDDGE